MLNFRNIISIIAILVRSGEYLNQNESGRPISIRTYQINVKTKKNRVWFR